MDRGTPRTGLSARKAGLAALGVLLLAVLAGGALLLTRGGQAPAAAGARSSAPAAAGGAGAAGGAAPVAAGQPSGAATAADVALAGPPAVVTVPPGNGASRSHPGSPAARPSPSGSAAASSSAAALGGSAAPASTAPAGRPPAPAGPAAEDSAAVQQVLSLINQSRATAGLPALTISAGLTTSSSKHNLLMASGCGLSHQCSGEAALGARETAAGVLWNSAGENIGEGGPVADTSAAIAQMAVSLTQSMIDEKPPDDGHRMNILGSSYAHIGLAVYRDSSGTVWLTQDFSN
jgi:uncharacterized protein YkwD